MSYAEEIIKQSIQDQKLDRSRARRKYVEKLLNYYTGTNTEEYIAGKYGNYFDSASFSEKPSF